MPIIVDANVLIDYSDSDPSILQVYSKHIQPIFTPSVVLDEVDQLDGDSCSQLNIQTIQETMTTLNAAAVASPRISFEDNVCLILAQQNNWICATNDRRLHQECSKAAVSSIWGLKIMIELVSNNQLTRTEALNVANQIRANNPYVTAKVIQNFQVDLNAI